MFSLLRTSAARACAGPATTLARTPFAASKPALRAASSSNSRADGLTAEEIASVAAAEAQAGRASSSGPAPQRQASEEPKSLPVADASLSTSAASGALGQTSLSSQASLPADASTSAPSSIPSAPSSLSSSTLPISSTSKLRSSLTPLDYLTADGQLLPPSLMPNSPTKPKIEIERQVLDDTVAREDHPLWAFFHRDRQGKVQTLERLDEDLIRSGRAWSTEELRLKSFHDLHTLWYLLLREKNIAYTQSEEARRRGVQLRFLGEMAAQKSKIRLSMKRIKAVMTERQRVYAAAIEKDSEQRNLEAEMALIEEEEAKLAAMMAEEGDVHGEGSREGEGAGASPATSSTAGASTTLS